MKYGLCYNVPDWSFVRRNILISRKHVYSLLRVFILGNNNNNILLTYRVQNCHLKS